MLPGLAKKICSSEKHPNPPLDTRRLSDWVNGSTFTQSHGARSAHRIQVSSVTAILANGGPESGYRRFSLGPVTLLAPCEFFGSAKKSLRRLISSAVSGCIPGEHVFFANPGCTRTGRREQGSMRYFLAAPAEER